MTMIQPRIPDFPEHPSDGFQVKEDLPNGGYIIWTYSEAFNQWTFEVFKAALDGYIYTNQVLTTAPSILPRLAKDADPSDTTPVFLETQEQVNNTIAGVSGKLLAKGQRTQLNLDFLQNTLDGGYWIHKDRAQESELPGPSQFFALTKGGENAENFDDAYQFVFNSAGIDSSQQLGYAAQGTSLFLADVADGGYGLYVITGVEQIGNPEGGQFICTFDVAMQRGKAGGPINLNAHVEMKVMSPAVCLVQGEEPYVDDWGYLWYNPGTQELSVSEWHSGETPGSSDVTWATYKPGGGGEGGGGNAVHIGEDPPEGAVLGDEWFCNAEDDLSLYVLVELPDVWAPASPPVSLDGVAGDIQNIDSAVATVRADLFEVDNDLKQSQSDIKALTEAVDHGTREQTKLRSRIGDCEFLAGNALPKAGGQMTGNLEFKCKEEAEYWSYIKALRPAAWDKENQTHGLILDIGATNSYKQYFKIQGRAGRELFTLNDDGSASATLKGRLNCTEQLKVESKVVATEEYVDNAVKEAGNSSQVSYQKFYAKNKGTTSAYNKRTINWGHTGDEVKMNISVETYDQPAYRHLVMKNQDTQDYVVDFAMHRVGRLENGQNDWQLIMAGKTKTIRFLEFEGNRYIQITYDISKCLVHHPEDFVSSKDDTNKDDSNYVNFQLGNIFRY